MNRAEATACPHRLIRASAGSGKTYDLSSRYLGLLARGAEPRSILATTFTRKAAGEILGRVLTRLVEACGDQAAAMRLGADAGVPRLTAARCREMLDGLCRGLDRVSIATIDAWFARIGRSFAWELGLTPDATPAGRDDPLVVRLRLRAVEAMLADAAESDTAFQTLIDLLRRVHHDRARRSVTEALDTLVASLHAIYREYPDRGLWTAMDVPPGELDRAELQEAIAALDGLDGDAPNGHFRNALESKRNAARVQDWEAFLKGTFFREFDEPTPTYRRTPFPGTWLAALRPLYAHARAALVARLAEQNAATYELLRTFDAHFLHLLEAQRIELFDELTRALARTLPSRDELYYRLDGVVHHVLLDEFQDTSDEQYAVLRPLIEEVASQADGRSLFCVGDVKQAIYGWRGGRAEVFDRLEGDLNLPPEAIQTKPTSYRCCAAVLEAVNTVFPALDALPLHKSKPHLEAVAAQWSEGFEPHEPADPDRPGYVELVTTRRDADADEAGESKGEDDGSPALADAHWLHVAERVEALAEAHPTRSLGVLVGRNKTAALLLSLLRQRGLEASAESGVALTDDATVQSVLAALRLADHPASSVDAFHVAHSPMGRVAAQEDHAGPAGRSLGRRVRRALAAEGYAALLSRWARALAPSCDARAVLRLEQLVQLAEQYQPHATLRPGDFVRFVEQSAVEQPTPARLQVMTVYKAKGLGFDIVVLPELERTLGGDSSEVNVLRDQATGAARAIVRRGNETTRALHPLLQEAHEQATAAGFRDDLSVLYVAMTRARHAVHLWVKPLKSATRNGKPTGKPTSSGLSNLCYASILRQTLAGANPTLDEQATLWSCGDPAWDERLADPAPATPPPPEPGPIRVRLRRAQPATVVAPRRPSHARDAAPAVAELLGVEDRAGRDIGTLIHEWLARVGFLDEPDAVPDDAALRRLGRRVLPQHGDAWVGARLKEFHEMLRKPNLAAALCRAGADELWRERAFTVTVDGQTVNGVFDRVTLRRDGASGRVTEARLIDFKTDRVGPGELDAVVERHRLQLEAYRAALARLLGLPAERIAAELLMLRADAVVAL